MEYTVAIAAVKFEIKSLGIIFEFDTAKNQMTNKLSGGQRVWTDKKLL
jgi:hypothetical protein